MINKCITIQYIRAGEYDKALYYIERMTDCCETFWDLCIKESDDTGTIPLYIEIDLGSQEGTRPLKTCTREALIKYFECQLIESWGELGDKENNPIVTSERYKKCFGRVSNFKG